MTLSEKIEKAFAHRVVPTVVIEPEQYIQFDSDVEEALWFAGRDWRGITADDWHKNSCAIYFLSPDAFRYYLPSLLTLEALQPECTNMAVDAFIGILDHSPSMDAWDDHLVERFIGLCSEEFEVLKEWLVFMCENAPHLGTRTSGPGDTYARAFQTVDLLQQEAELRRMIEREASTGGPK
jgi:hypothetical protein